jgi:hypothetical protein
MPAPLDSDVVNPTPSFGRRSNARFASKRAKIHGKAATEVKLIWEVWENSKPAVDPVTGATLATLSSGQALEQQCVTRANVHYVSPATVAQRTYSEVQAGDCIVDFVSPLYQITNAGDTSLRVGAVVDEWTLNYTNRQAGITIPATGTEIDIESLSKLVFEIAGVRWVQEKTGEELTRSWDAIIADIEICRSILLRRTT